MLGESDESTGLATGLGSRLNAARRPAGKRSAQTNFARLDKLFMTFEKQDFNFKKRIF